MVDVWQFAENPVDDISGPLVEVQVLRDGELTQERGVASGNTLIVLGLEELHRRMSDSSEEYLINRPSLPKELDARIA